MTRTSLAPVSRRMALGAAAVVGSEALIGPSAVLSRDADPARQHMAQASPSAPAPTAGAAMAIDLPDVKAEVTAAFAAYEAALVGNDVAVLEADFWDDARTIRYGAGENLYGMEAIRAFRRARSSVGINRTLKQTVITTYGRDAATAMTMFVRDSAPGKIGRQSQTWIRLSDGWKVVAAHVSIIAA